MPDGPPSDESPDPSEPGDGSEPSPGEPGDGDTTPDAPGEGQQPQPGDNEGSEPGNEPRPDTGSSEPVEDQPDSGSADGSSGAEDAPQLAQTGAGTTAGVGLAAGLIAVGGGTLMVRRRASSDA